MSNSSKYHIKVNSSKDFTVESSVLESLDLIKLDKQNFHVINNSESLKVKLLDINESEKLVRLEIEGQLYSCKISNELDMMIDKMGLKADTNKKIKDITAPMPGKVLDVLVKAGQEIEEGDSLLILEAMKMENLIKASGAGTVTGIEVKKGDAVEKGQLLISL